MLKSDDNFYEPSYFYMKLDTTKLLKDIISSDEESVLIHEYIHLLQDISIETNRNMMWQNVNNYRALSKEILEKGNTKRPIECHEENILINSKVNDSLWGTDANIKNGEIIDIKIINEEIADRIKRKAIYLIVLSNGKEIQYKLGRRDFIESMALAIENYIYKIQNDDISDFPYRSIENILKFKKIKTTSFIVSQICELALSSYDPVGSLIRYFDKGKNKTSTQEIYDAMYTGMKITNYDGSIHSIEENQKYVFNESKIMLLDWFQTPLFHNIKEWLSFILDFGYSMRLSNKIFLSSILTLPPTKSRRLIHSYIIKTGIPVVYNKNYDVQIVDPSLKNVDTFLLLALNTLYTYLKSSMINCNLFCFCEKAKETIVDDNCHYNIMARLKKEKLCPMAVWIKTFKFQDLE